MSYALVSTTCYYASNGASVYIPNCLARVLAMLYEQYVKQEPQMSDSQIQRSLQEHWFLARAWTPQLEVQGIEVVIDIMDDIAEEEIILKACRYIADPTHKAADQRFITEFFADMDGHVYPS